MPTPRAARRDPLPPGLAGTDMVLPKVLASLELQKVVSANRWGVIFAATLPGTGERRAVGVLDPAMASLPGLVDAFLSSAEEARERVHPSLVRVFGAGTERGLTWIASEWLEGRDGHCLLRRCRSGEPLPVRYALSLALAATEAVSQLHASGSPASAQHGRLALDKLFVCTDGQFKLIGIGLPTVGHEAWPMPDDVDHFAMLAPEQVSEGVVGPEADLWSLTLLTQVLVTGANPFQRPTLAQTSAAIQAGEARPRGEVRHLPPSLALRLRRGLASDPTGRFASAGELATELRAELDEVGGLVTPAEWAQCLHERFPADVGVDTIRELNLRDRSARVLAALSKADLPPRGAVSATPTAVLESSPAAPAASVSAATVQEAAPAAPVAPPIPDTLPPVAVPAVAPAPAPLLFVLGPDAADAGGVGATQGLAVTPAVPVDEEAADDPPTEDTDLHVAEEGPIVVEYRDASAPRAGTSPSDPALAVAVFDAGVMYDDDVPSPRPPALVLPSPSLAPAPTPASGVEAAPPPAPGFDARETPSPTPRFVTTAPARISAPDPTPKPVPPAAAPRRTLLWIAPVGLLLVLAVGGYALRHGADDPRPTPPSVAARVAPPPAAPAPDGEPFGQGEPAAPPAAVATDPSRMPEGPAPVAATEGPGTTTSASVPPSAASASPSAPPPSAPKATASATPTPPAPKATASAAATRTSPPPTPEKPRPAAATTPAPAEKVAVGSPPAKPAASTVAKAEPVPVAKVEPKPPTPPVAAHTPAAPAPTAAVTTTPTASTWLEDLSVDVGSDKVVFSARTSGASVRPFHYLDQDVGSSGATRYVVKLKGTGARPGVGRVPVAAVGVRSLSVRQDGAGLVLVVDCDCSDERPPRLSSTADGFTLTIPLAH